ncbi:hypothetical protein AB6A40_002730 [Gnathostoma spinigerum]|uniref:Uncharacterized protein n=1 Tax=Gnathostoma spinigerum TaxID=75299 RepID=A0ABD6E9Z5_9BILA
MLHLVYILGNPRLLCWEEKDDETHERWQLNNDRFSGKKYVFDQSQRNSEFFMRSPELCIPCSVWNMVTEDVELSDYTSLHFGFRKEFFALFLNFGCVFVTIFWMTMALHQSGSRLFVSSTATLPFISIASLGCALCTVLSVEWKWPEIWESEGWPQTTSPYDTRSVAVELILPTIIDLCIFNVIHQTCVIRPWIDLRNDTRSKPIKSNRRHQIKTN